MTRVDLPWSTWPAVATKRKPVPYNRRSRVAPRFTSMAHGGQQAHIDPGTGEGNRQRRCLARANPAQSVWRRWTGIEPAVAGILRPTALKAAESTRHPDTSEPRR